VIFKPVYKSVVGNVSELCYARGVGALFVVGNETDLTRITEFPQDSLGRGLFRAYTQLLNGEGDFTEVASFPLYYDLYHAVARLDGSTDDFAVVKRETEVFSVLRHAKVQGVYTSEPLVADEDFGYWKTISWSQCADVSRVVVALKVAETLDELAALDWQYYISEEPTPAYYGSTTSSCLDVTKSLDRFNLKGRYMQFQITLETTAETDIPTVSEFLITYATKEAVYFFTRKIRIDRTSNIDDILMTASVTTPQKTEVRFGVTDTNSAEWEDYQIVDLDELTHLPESFGTTIKVGIRLSSYSMTEVPIVHEFAFLLGTDSDNLLNQ